MVSSGIYQAANSNSEIIEQKMTIFNLIIAADVQIVTKMPLRSC